MIPADVLTRLQAHIAEAGKHKPRVLVAVAGPPGAGKSTVAGALAEVLEAAAVLPMDGFHLDNETLRAGGLFERKGAPETFDTEGLRLLLEKVSSGGDVHVPTFDRAADSVVVDGARIRAADQVVIVEGNYLLLNEGAWRDLQVFWDLTLMIDVPFDELERRLIQRWLDHGLSPGDAVARARQNDLRNAELVMNRSAQADIVLKNG